LITPKLLIQKQSNLQVLNEIPKTLGEQQSLSASDIENKLDIYSTVLTSAKKFLEKQDAFLGQNLATIFL